MDDPTLTRRTLLGSAVALAGPHALARTQKPTTRPAGNPKPRPASQPSKGTERLVSSYAAGGNIWVRVGSRVFCCYRAGREQKYPYVYPLIGPATGLSMTEETSLPWPHHRSLFLSCDRVNGGDYWQEDNNRGQIISRGPKADVSDADRKLAVTITDLCDWHAPDGKNIIEDHRTIRITAPDAATRLLDWRVILTAKTDIRISKTNHSLFSVRVARELAPAAGGWLLNSAGRSGEAATGGQPAVWCGFSGTRAGRTESIVLIDHPSNPWYPSKWFTRDYGFASPTPFWWLDEDKPYELRTGRTLDLRYRVLVLGRGINRAEIDSLAKQFST